MRAVCRKTVKQKSAGFYRPKAVGAAQRHWERGRPDSGVFGNRNPLWANKWKNMLTFSRFALHLEADNSMPKGDKNG